MSRLAMLGGKPVRELAYPVWPVYDEQDIDAVTQVIRDRRWGGYPEPLPHAEKFAKAFASYQGANYGIAMANGTITLEVALKALGIGWRDEVIVPALSFVSTANAVMAAGALPVFVDVNVDDFTLDLDQVEACITPQTRAIMPVHLGQSMVDMDRLTKLAAHYQLAIIEDSAHAFGQMWRNTGAGCFGEFGSFSHEASKSLTSGEGGTLLTQNEKLAHLAHSLIDCGRPKDKELQLATSGCNYRLSEFQAALLSTALTRLPAQQKARAAQAETFEKLVGNIPGIRLLKRDPRITRRNFWRYIVAIDTREFSNIAIKILVQAMEAEGLGCSTGYPSINKYDLFQPSRSRLPVAVEYAERLDKNKMSLPVAEAYGDSKLLYIKENVFRSGEAGIVDAISILNKVQQHASELNNSRVTA
jgi:dTDP-4-amino-4,6-dideoxygalactose transaminase